MAEHSKTIDIDDIPELLRLVDEVRRSDEPRVLRCAGEDLAVVTPVSRTKKTRHRGRAKTEADYEAFRSAAGGWKDLIDVDEFIEHIYESRRLSTRPPVEL